MKNNEGICMSDELAERAKIIADATGRTVSDVLEDLGDDGILNESNHFEKDLITQLKEAAELISTVQQINNEVSENTVLNGGDNKTNVTVETTLEGDIVDRAIASVSRKVVNLKKIAIIIIPVFLLLTGSSMSNMGMFNTNDLPPDEYYNNEYGGCLNPDADNYDDYASWEDGSCYWDEPEPEPEPQPEPEPEPQPEPEPEPEPIEGCTDPDAENYDSEAEQDDGSCSYPPEPQCNGSAFFYSVTESWFNETNETISLQVSWDADWSCGETKQIEVDIYLKDNNGTSIYYGMPKYNITAEQGDNKFVHIENLTKPTTGLRLCLQIWWVHDNNYYSSDEYNKTF